MSYSIRLAPALVAMAVAVALAACSGATTSTEGTSVPAAPVAQGAAPAAAGLSTAPVAPQVTGHARAIADALSEVPLRDDQRAEIETMAAASEQRHQTVNLAHAQVATALAAQIEAGSVDRAALQPAIDAAVTAGVAARPLDRAAMEHLHALLTTEQRGQFVDAMEARGKSHAHGSHGARMEEWATDLKLTDDQRAQIGAMMKAQRPAHHEDFRSMHAQGKGFMESFRADTFASAPAPAPTDADPRARANEHADHLVAIIAQVLPLLTAEQRTLAAAKIRAHADSLEAIGGPSPE